MKTLWCAALWAVLTALPALGQPVSASGSEIGLVRTDFEYGKYKEVLLRGRNLLDRGGLNDEQLSELHRLAGVAAFNLQQMADAERHLTTLLRIDPDSSLDPFLFPPPAVQYLEKLRKQLASDLEVIRQERRLQSDRRRREEDDKRRAALEAEDMRRKLDELTSRVTVRTVEKRVFLVNFVPFGAGQFQQDRTSLGTLLAATEGALAATSVIAFFAYGSLFRQYSLNIPNVLNPDGSGSFSVSYNAIPSERRTEATVWRIAQYTSAIGFYLVWGYGVVDAVLNHQDQVVSTQVEERTRPPKAAPPEPTPAPGRAPAPAPPVPMPPATKRPSPTAPRAQAGLTLIPGGLGAQVRVEF